MDGIVQAAGKSRTQLSGFHSQVLICIISFMLKYDFNFNYDFFFHLRLFVFQTSGNSLVITFPLRVLS